MSLYNIAPFPEPGQWYTGEQIRAAASGGASLRLNLGRLAPAALCRLAASVKGWCTVVLANGAIVQEWAGCFAFVGEEVK